jgi:hypothetical protein
MSFLADDLERLIPVLDDFAHELLQLSGCFHKDFSAPEGRLVIFPSFPLYNFGSAAKKAELLQQMQRRIQGSLAETVTMANQLFGDFRAIDRLLGRVVQDVQTDKAIEKWAGNRILKQWVSFDVGFRCWISIS